MWWWKVIEDEAKINLKKKNEKVHLFSHYYLSFYLKTNRFYFAKKLGSLLKYAFIIFLFTNFFMKIHFCYLI